MRGLSHMFVATLLLTCLGCPTSTPAPEQPVQPPAGPAETPKPQPVEPPAPPQTPWPAPAEPNAPGMPAAAPVSEADQALARQLNTEGYRLYQERKYSEAIPKFEASAQTDPNYALPPYNLACTLCLVRGGEGTCENDAYKERILEQLQTSIRLDPARLDKAKQDSDLSCVHDTLGYQKLLGYSPNNPADAKRLLVAVSWYGPAPGAFGNMSGLDFKDDGTIAVWQLDVTDEVKVLRYTGTYLLDGLRVVVRLDQPEAAGGSGGFTGVLSERGLETDSPLGSFTDMPSECSA